eukprot:278381-Chlamydomonas_euryale.AAC.12
MPSQHARRFSDAAAAAARDRPCTARSGDVRSKGGRRTTAPGDWSRRRAKRGRDLRRRLGTAAATARLKQLSRWLSARRATPAMHPHFGGKSH